MNNIRKLRKELKLTQTELANLCNISQGALSGYETGKYEPDNATLMKMADLFHVSIDAILGYEKPGEIDSSVVDEIAAMKAHVDGIDVPRTAEARILSAGIDRMPAKDRKRALEFMKLIFNQYEEYFEERNDDDDSEP